MPRRARPEETTRSEHWLRQAVSSADRFLDAAVVGAFGWPAHEKITWLSPVASDGHAEYYDQAFLERLGNPTLRSPLSAFWPARGPRWDGLAGTESGKLLLVEAKAHIDECVTRLSAESPTSQALIRAALAQTKSVLKVADDAPWETPFYQYANRLAHLYHLAGLNGLDAYLLFLYFADAPDVPSPSTRQQWEGAIRLTKRCLGLSATHAYANRVADCIVSVPELPAAMR